MTNAPKHFQAYFLATAFVIASQAMCVTAQQKPYAPGTNPRQATAQRDGQHDFDFELGTWKTRLSRRLRPLTGSNTWVEYEGTSVVRKVWGGRANLVELEVGGPAGSIEGLSLRLYNREARQWSLNFSNSASGTLTPPVVGEFKDGRGEFFGQETLNGRAIFVRFIIQCRDSDTCRFEQAFSDDGGKTWEVNWVAVDTRVRDEPGVPPPPARSRNPALSGWGRAPGEAPRSITTAPWYSMFFPDVFSSTRGR